MKYLWIFALILLFGCKNTENKNPISNENNSKNTDWIVGKWKIEKWEGDFFPFEYDDTKCYLVDVYINFKKDNIIEFQGKECTFQEKFKISNKSIQLYSEKWKFDYEILERNKNSVTLISHHIPSQALVNMDITQENLDTWEKKGFEIVLQKIK